MASPLNVRRLSLRFPSTNVEEAFVRGTKGKLAYALWVTSTWVFTATVLGYSLSFAKSTFEGETAKVQFLRFLSGVINMVASCAMMCFTGRSGCVDWIHPVALEISGVFLTTIVSAMVFFGNSWYVAKMVGVDTSALGQAAPDSDSTMLLALTGILVFEHLFMPVRWYFLIPHEIFCLLLYLFCGVVVGSPETGVNVLSNFSVFCILTFLLAFGKRQLEHHERAAFQNLVAEKSARFEAEFQLSRMQDEAGSANVGQQSRIDDLQSSVPETTVTGMVFASASIDTL